MRKNTIQQYFYHLAGASRVHCHCPEPRRAHTESFSICHFKNNTHVLVPAHIHTHPFGRERFVCLFCNDTEAVYFSLVCTFHFVHATISTCRNGHTQAKIKPPQARTQPTHTQKEPTHTHIGAERETDQAKKPSHRARIAEIVYLRAYPPEYPAIVHARGLHGMA